MNLPRTFAHVCSFRVCLCVAMIWFLSLVDKNRTARADQPALEGYSNFAELTKKVQSLAKPGIATVTSLAKSPGGREVWLVTIGTGEVDRKPAVLMVGNVEGAHVVGSEIAVLVAKRFIEKVDDETIKSVLEQYTLYVIPRPNPDGSEAFFRAPLHQRAGNDTRTDDDRDHEAGEDPADDLNDDGVISMMRVEDPAGKYMPHPNDERVLIEADAKKNETGRYSIYIEGKDDDGDEQFNEDGASGVSFNRNFTFRYPYFQKNAGPHQVSEAETRAIADFAFDHPNIAAVFCFSLEDNLVHPWKPADQQGRIKTSIQKEDAAYVDFIAEKYREMHGGKDAPSAPAGQGSFSEWAYFHYGRWSLAARGWWIPRIEPDKKADEPKTSDAKAGADSKDDDAKRSDEKKTDKKADDKKPDTRGTDMVNALRWIEREKIDGFVPWKEVQHPNFPNKKVEVGGFRPFMLLNPPAKEFDSLAQKHADFLIDFTKLLPQLKLSDTEVDALGAGVFRLSCTVLNTGYLPTMAEMGTINGAPYPLQIELQLPEETKFLKGHPRSDVNRLAGRGGKMEVIWLVRTAEAKPATGKIVVYAPAVGRAESHVELKP